MIRRLDGLLHGDYQTLFRGFGLDLADLREYQYHDDVRHIDWNVTARLQTPYVRVYNEDREVTAWFLLDLSPSVDFGSQVKKRSVSAEFVTVLARLLTRHGNRVGALFYGDSVDTVIPARSGRRHVLHILHRILSRPRAFPVGRDEPARFTADRFSGYAKDDPSFSSCPISSARPAGPSRSPTSRSAMRSSAVRLYDPLEMELPDLGAARDARRRDRRAVIRRHPRPRPLASASQLWPSGARRELRSAFSQAGVDALELSTDDDLVDAILRFADLRKRRSQLAAGGSLPQHLRGSHEVSVA